MHDLLPVERFGQDVIGSQVQGFGPQVIVGVVARYDEERVGGHRSGSLQQILPRALLNMALADHDRVMLAPERGNRPRRCVDCCEPPVGVREDLLESLAIFRMGAYEQNRNETIRTNLRRGGDSHDRYP